MRYPTKRTLVRLVVLASCAATAACTDQTASITAPDARASLTLPVSPQPINTWDDWVGVSAGGSHSCGVTQNGRVYCWGSNASGQLGSAGGDALRPRLIDTTGLGALRFQMVSAGEDHTCALSGSLGWGYLYCWGSNLGATPTAVPLGLTFSTVSVGTYEACAVTPLGVAYCWPLGGTPWPVTTAPLSISFATISVGHDHTCGMSRYNGDAYCWGANGFGQLGVNSFSSRARPDLVLRGPYSGVDAGKNFSCGISTATGLFAHPGANCWGTGARGQVGNGNSFGSPDPEAVVDPPGRALDVVSAGGSHACAIDFSSNGHGDAWCWGDNSYGQLGDGLSVSRLLLPDDVAGDRVYKQISAGGDHSCALSQYTRAANVSGATPARAVVMCWGKNDHGQLGHTTTTNSNVPVTAVHPQSLIVVLP